MSPITHLIGRSSEMCEIIQQIDKGRLVTILGFPGIGKTMITKSVGLFLEERQKFSSGIIYLSLNKIYQADRLIPKLYNQIKQQLTLDQHSELNKHIK